MHVRTYHGNEWERRRTSFRRHANERATVARSCGNDVTRSTIWRTLDNVNRTAVTAARMWVSILFNFLSFCWVRGISEKPRNVRCLQVIVGITKRCNSSYLEREPAVRESDRAVSMLAVWHFARVRSCWLDFWIPAELPHIRRIYFSLRWIVHNCATRKMQIIGMKEKSAENGKEWLRQTSCEFVRRTRCRLCNRASVSCVIKCWYLVSRIDTSHGLMRISRATYSLIKVITCSPIR